MTVFEELQRRGLIAQMTHPERIQEMLDNNKLTFYIGFDATADSLHVGHFLQIVVMKHLQMAGHRPIALLGTGTTMVGDPSGKSDMRKMMDQETIRHNADCFQRQISRFIDFSDGKAILERNDWLLDLNYIQFMREIGVHFSVNEMLTAECFKQRMERGLSFFEFNYMLMQSYDFLMLYRKYHCQLEMGGNDQWSNILGGMKLVRRVENDEAFGMTFTLLTTKEGKKMGKTENGAVWLDPNKTSPYEFFQYWRNVADADVVNCLKMLTFIPIEEIEAMETWEGEQLNKAKELLAYNLTEMVHGKDEAEKALEASRALFGAGGNHSEMPTTILLDTDFADGAINIMDLLVKTGLAPSKGEARRLIQQGGITVNDTKITDFAHNVAKSDVAAAPVIIKKGKKVFHKVTL